MKKITILTLYTIYSMLQLFGLLYIMTFAHTHNIATFEGIIALMSAIADASIVDLAARCIGNKN